MEVGKNDLSRAERPSSAGAKNGGFRWKTRPTRCCVWCGCVFV